MFVEVVGDFALGKVFEFFAFCQIIDGDDVGNAALVEGFDDVAADKASTAPVTMMVIFGFLCFEGFRRHWMVMPSEKIYCPSSASTNSANEQTAVPSFATTTLTAVLARYMASGMVQPAASPKPIPAMTVSPAPDTS